MAKKTKAQKTAAKKKATAKQKTAAKQRINILGAALIKRAKKLGMTDEQIATYTDSVALTMACSQIKPQATLHPELPVKKPVYRRPVGVPTQAAFVTVVTEARATHVSRSTYDEGQLSDFCCREKIDPRSITKLTFTRDCTLNSRSCFETTIEIEYVKEVFN